MPGTRTTRRRKGRRRRSSALLLAATVTALCCGCSDDGEPPADSGASLDLVADAAAADSTLDLAVDQQAQADLQAPDAGPPCDHPAVTEDCSGGWCTVPAGCFWMGSPVDEPCRVDGETRHPVTLGAGFRVADKEVTQDAFSAAMGYSPQQSTACGSCPVANVSWHEAAAYCNVLSANEGLIGCYSCTGSGKDVSCAEVPAYSKQLIFSCKGYRLPTEAEWEYAYRAGATTALYNGQLSGCIAADASADAIAWYANNAGGTTHPGAQKAANAWGLYDMAGNVAEWCNDPYGTDLGADPVSDPWGLAAGGKKVVRGGAYNQLVGAVRAAYRYYEDPAARMDTLGFRCVRTIHP